MWANAGRKPSVSLPRSLTFMLFRLLTDRLLTSHAVSVSVPVSLKGPAQSSQSVPL